MSGCIVSLASYAHFDNNPPTPDLSWSGRVVTKVRTILTPGSGLSRSSGNSLCFVISNNPCRVGFANWK